MRRAPAGGAVTPASFYRIGLAEQILQWHEQEPFDAVLTFCTGMVYYARLFERLAMKSNGAPGRLGLTPGGPRSPGSLGVPAGASEDLSPSHPGRGTGSSEGRIRHVLDLVEAVTGHRPTPTAVARTGWLADPFARGAYSTRGAASPEDFITLAAPHAGRVLFAGEATTLERIGYADGAFRTGIREAKRLLGRAEVEIGRLPHV